MFRILVRLDVNETPMLERPEIRLADGNPGSGGVKIVLLEAWGRGRELLRSKGSQGVIRRGVQMSSEALRGCSEDAQGTL